MNLDERITLMCAFRYALGRRTYVTESVSSQIIENWNKLNPDMQSQIIEEIQEAIQGNNIGDKCDEQNWSRILLLSKALRINEERSCEE